MGVAAELVAVAGVSFAVGFSGALSPGPLTVLTIREAARHGVRAGPLATLGHGAVELALVVALALGLSQLLDEDSAAAAAISVLGGLVLLAMGVALLRAAPREAPPTVTPTRVMRAAGGLAAGWSLRGGAGRVALAGALVSLANPYWVIWWATVGAALTAESLSAGAAGPGAFFVGHILSDLVWLTLVASLVGSGRHRLGVRGYRLLLAGCGAFLLALGLLFAGVGGLTLA